MKLNIILTGTGWCFYDRNQPSNLHLQYLRSPAGEVVFGNLFF